MAERRPRGTKKPIMEPLVGKVSQNDLRQPLTQRAGGWLRLTSRASTEYLFSMCFPPRPSWILYPSAQLCPPDAHTGKLFFQKITGHMSSLVNKSEHATVSDC